jgi:hypothetical protein
MKINNQFSEKNQNFVTVLSKNISNFFVPSVADLKNKTQKSDAPSFFFPISNLRAKRRKVLKIFGQKEKERRKKEKYFQEILHQKTVCFLIFFF